MAWSTRQLADLAGTTVKAVRHYHEIGLLEMPERASNGYKQYQVAHLVRLLQIKRLSDLGIPLAQIATMDRTDDEPDAAIRELDSELESTIARLERIRSELAVILKHRAPVDVPAAFSTVADGLSETDRALIMVFSRVFSEEALDDLRDMLQRRDPTDDEFDVLPADADEATIQRLAEKIAPNIRRQEIEYPWLKNPGSNSPRGAAVAQSTMAQAIVELYNPAQLRVMVLADRIAHNPTGKGEEETPRGSTVPSGIVREATAQATREAAV